LLPKQEQYLLGIISHKQDIHGNPIGKSPSNPIFETRIYQVEFPAEGFLANVILEDKVDYEVTEDALTRMKHSKSLIMVTFISEELPRDGGYVSNERMALNPWRPQKTSRSPSLCKWLSLP
jgi:hypothetical protein